MKIFLLILLTFSFNLFALDDCFIKVSLLANSQTKILINTRYIRNIQNNISNGSTIHSNLKQYLVKESIEDIEKMINSCYKK